MSPYVNKASKAKPLGPPKPKENKKVQKENA
jgi:hypothetical protein